MAMRNYGAMLDPKLMKCIAELSAGSGDAFDRVMAKQNAQNLHKPEASFQANLDLAIAVAKSRGLNPAGPTTSQMPLPPRPRRPAPPAPKEPEVDLCRGCAGTGVDRSVHVRTLQLAEGVWSIGPKPNAKRLTTTLIQLGAPDARTAPLVELLRIFAKAQREGREVKGVDFQVPFPLTKADACKRCHGTGVPQLSTTEVTK